MFVQYLLDGLFFWHFQYLWPSACSRVYIDTLKIGVLWWHDQVCLLLDLYETLFSNRKSNLNYCILLCGCDEKSFMIVFRGTSIESTCEFPVFKLWGKSDACKYQDSVSSVV